MNSHRSLPSAVRTGAVEPPLEVEGTDVPLVPPEAWNGSRVPMRQGMEADPWSCGQQGE